MARVKFTLIEIVVAVVILTLSLAALLQLLTHSQLRVGNASEKWRETHMLIQAAEYIMLAGNPEEPEVPEEFFPYNDYYVECSVEEAEGLPEEYKELDGQIPLKRWYIRLIRNHDQAERASISIDRFAYEEADKDE